jgi:hypothetical protein
MYPEESPEIIIGIGRNLSEIGDSVGIEVDSLHQQGQS